MPNDPSTAQSLREQLRASLEARHGPLMGGAPLQAALGHRSAAALRQARRRGKLDVALFTLPKRRGLFALTSEVANWIAEARATAASQNHAREGESEPET